MSYKKVGDILDYQDFPSPRSPLHKINHLPLMSPNFKRPLLSKHDTEISQRRSDGKEGGKLSTAGAVYTLVNLYVGIGLLSKPYALASAGWLSLVALALIAITLCYTGKLLVRSFLIDPTSNFQDLGFKAFGIYGKYGVVFFVLLEFTGALVVSLIFLFRNAAILINNLKINVDIINNTSTLVVACTVLLSPTVMYLNFQKLSILSFIGVVSNTSICICVFCISVYVYSSDCETLPSYIGVYCLDNFSWSDNLLPREGMEHFSIGIGIYVLSLAGHACLPSIYREMRHPEHFNRALDISFLCMYIIYASLAVCGYLVYGNDVDVLVSIDINRFPGGWVSDLLTFLIISGVLCTVAPVISILSSIPEEMLGWYKEEEEIVLPTSILGTPMSQSTAISHSSTSTLSKECKQRIFRLLVLICSSMLSFLLIDRLNILEATTGGLCTMMTSLILPAAFALTLLKDRISLLEKVTCIILIASGLIAGILLSAEDIGSLIHNKIQKLGLFHIKN